MKSKFNLFRRGAVFYMEDTATGKQTSLRTKDETEAKSLLNARNEAQRQPVLNLHLARAYLTASDPAFIERTWQPLDSHPQGVPPLHPAQPCAGWIPPKLPLWTGNGKAGRESQPCDRSGARAGGSTAAPLLVLPRCQTSFLDDSSCENSQVRCHKPMITAALKKSPVHDHMQALRPNHC